MYQKIWQKTHQSVALFRFYSKTNIKIKSLTGFKVGEYLITDEYVRKISGYEFVEISFVGENGYSIEASITLSSDEFKKCLVMGINDENEPFVVVNIKHKTLESIPSLTLHEGNNIHIGKQIASLGYQLSQDNLSIKTGIISSFYKKDGVEYIQFDGSVKQGNAGSPLIDYETGKVVGILGYRLTELTQSHKRLKDIINNNIHLLKKYQGKYNLDDIDIIQVLIAGENQIKYIASEIYSTANMRVGFAYPSTRLIKFFKNNLILEELNHSINTLVNF